MLSRDHFNVLDSVLTAYILVYAVMALQTGNPSVILGLVNLCFASAALGWKLCRVALRRAKERAERMP